MQAPFDNIVQHLFHQPSLLSVTVDELERMAQQHPYFAAAHFLLLKKMQDTAHPSFDSQLHKTTLYFNNPLWLQFLLQPEAAAGFTVLEKAPFITDEKAAEPALVPEPGDAATQQYYFVEELQPADTIHAADKDALTEHRENDTPGLPVQANGIMDVITDVFAEPVEENNPGNQSGVVAQAAQTDETVAATFNNETVIDTEIVQEENSTAPVLEQPLEAKSQQDTAAMADISQIEEPIPQDVLPASDTESNIQETMRADSTAAGEPVAVIAHSPEQAAHADEEAPLPLDATPMLPLTGEEKPLLKTIIETPAAKDDLLFEPYHTVDYFASQGIKLSKMEANARDKLGTQLRSFTEWLKTMKKLPQVSIDKMLSENDESKVVEDAIHSIENKEVITEAMAEVFEKQGLTDKAMEVYRKLSLLNPSKSAYFAAKIDLLKH